MSEPSPAPEIMTIRLDHVGPVELQTLTASLSALSAYHARYADRIGATINGDMVKLYVKEIRSGSIIVDLVALAMTALPIAGGINTVVSFAKTMIGVTDYLRGMVPAPPEGTKPRDVQDVAAFFEPAAADPKAVTTIIAAQGGTVNVTQVFTSDAANVVQNRARNYLALQADPVTGRLQQQLFYFHQVRDGSRSSVGDRGVIPAVWPGPVKTVFANPAAKAAMLGDPLFRKLYVVDVDVQSIDGRPRLYRILHVESSFDRDD